jgi:hypothetical protein
MAVIGITVLSFDGEDRKIQVFDQVSRHIILSAQRIGGAKSDLGSSGQRVLIKTAVSVVTWRQAERRIPFRGFSFSKRLRINLETGIAISAHSIRRRPFSDNEISLM